MTATPGSLANPSERTSSSLPTPVITNISSGGNNTSKGTDGLSCTEQILLGTLTPGLALLATIIGSWYSGRTKRKHDPKVPSPTNIVDGVVQDARGGFFVISQRHISPSSSPRGHNLLIYAGNLNFFAASLLQILIRNMVADKRRNVHTTTQGWGAVYKIHCTSTLQT